MDLSLNEFYNSIESQQLIIREANKEITTRSRDLVQSLIGKHFGIKCSHGTKYVTIEGVNIFDREVCVKAEFLTTEYTSTGGGRYYTYYNCTFEKLKIDTIMEAHEFCFPLNNGEYLFKTRELMSKASHKYQDGLLCIRLDKRNPFIENSNYDWGWDLKKNFQH
jgi:hypothetical protein